MTDGRKRDDWLANAVTGADLAREYPTIFKSYDNLRYHFQHRATNGLEAADVCRKIATGGVLWHKERAIDWMLRL